MVFKLQEDPSIDFRQEHFGARVEGETVFIPTALMELTNRIAKRQGYINMSPEDLAGFLYDSPTDLCMMYFEDASQKSDRPNYIETALCIDNRQAQKLTNKFLDFLEENGVDISAIRRMQKKTSTRRYGAKPPGPKDDSGLIM